jgi:tRNA pseudouridine55 synthase
VDHVYGGLLMVDKPQGLTSHDVVARVRRAARTKRVGHAGTLDPFATGLLVIAVGQCTRLLPYVHGEPKVYETVIAFGAETDSADVTGQVTRTALLPDRARLPAALASLTGRFPQTPPGFSAKHVNGTRAYELARRGIAVDLAPVEVEVFSWDVLDAAADSLRVRITCAGGTYVRALARDLGRVLESAAHCHALRRIASGGAHVDNAVSLEQLAPGSIADGVIALASPLSMLQPMAHEFLEPDALAALQHGRSVPATVAGESRGALISHDGVVLAVAERVDDGKGGERWQPRVVLARQPGAEA